MAQTRYVNTASTVGTQDGTTNTPGSSGTAAFATLQQALEVFSGALTDQFTIWCEGSAADTAACDQASWDFTTTATNYLRIIGEQSPNHPNFDPTKSGKWATDKYRITVTNVNGMYNNSPAHLRIEGMQVHVTVNDTDSYIGIKTSNANVTDSTADYRVSHCIVRATLTNGSVTGYQTSTFGGGSGQLVRYWNCLAYDCTSGYTFDYATSEIYNSTAHSCDFGFIANATDGMKAVNCLGAASGSVDFVAGGTFASGTSFNASSDGSAPGTNSRTSQTFTFVNAASDDFHLDSGDGGAKDFGTSDPASGLYSDDVDGGTRSGSWDIGFDEQGVAAGGGGGGTFTVTGPFRTGF